MTMLKIRAGALARRDEAAAADPATRELIREFFLSDREITLGQFQQFVNDPLCPKHEKPADWQGADQSISPTAEYAVQQVSWYDAILFCNWLSHKEGLTPSYERSGRRETPPMTKAEYDEWILVPNANGYRLPADAEWEYACRAGTSTDFASGTDEDMLRKYAVVRTNRPAPCGSKLPNGWGLFDMHGNLWEWCHDPFEPAADVAPDITPSRDSEGQYRRVFRRHRGGGWHNLVDHCRSANRAGWSPEYRWGDLTFRVALSAVP
jgi:formylglycine-generating enzyme required for sulfatase activity